jgi:rhodanese-related sulfurtransferase
MAEPFTLGSVMKQIRRDYPSVNQMTADVFAASLDGASKAADKDGENLKFVLFDVREVSEYAVSHIPGAVRVDPGIGTSEFIRKFGQVINGKTVVFYCSVGVRSSKLANASQRQLESLGAKRVYNLEGGIFAWHNRQMPLVNQRGPTQFVHPYNQKWGTLLIHSELHRYRPDS